MLAGRTTVALQVREGALVAVVAHALAHEAVAHARLVQLTLGPLLLLQVQRKQRAAFACRKGGRACGSHRMSLASLKAKAKTLGASFVCARQEAAAVAAAKVRCWRTVEAAAAARGARGPGLRSSAALRDSNSGSFSLRGAATRGKARGANSDARDCAPKGERNTDRRAQGRGHGGLAAGPQDQVTDPADRSKERQYTVPEAGQRAHSGNA
jgi:hypothetical protein